MSKTNWLIKFNDNEGNEYYMTENGYYYLVITYNGKQRSSRITKQHFNIAKELYYKKPANRMF